MARNVEDIALMMGAIAGPDDRCPISIAEPGGRFLQPLQRDFQGVRIGWSLDFGHLPLDDQVRNVLAGRRQVFTSLGCQVVDDQPNFRDADEVFKAWRAWAFEHKFRRLLETNRDQLKETIIWNAEEGAKLTGPELATIEQKRTRLYHRVREFMQTHDYLVFCVSQVPPFPIDVPYVTEISGQKMETYIDWMKSCYYISAIGLPAISVPAGFTADGLPVGLQIVGRHQDDFGVIQLAYAFQEATKFAQQRPSVAV